MKALVTLLCLLSFASSAQMATSNDINITISTDTVYNNQQPYCLLQQEENNYVIRNLHLERMAQIESIVIGEATYYKVEVSMLYKTVYLKPIDGDIVQQYVASMIANGALDAEGYYDEYGTRLLWKQMNENTDAISYEELQQLEKKQNVKNWSISYETTSNADSTIILADNKPVAYYKTVRFEDMGVDRFRKSLSADYAYTRFYIYSMSNKLVAEIRRPYNVITITVLLFQSDEELKFKYLSKNKNIITLTTKLLLAKGAI